MYITASYSIINFGYCWKNLKYNVYFGNPHGINNVYYIS